MKKKPRKWKVDELTIVLIVAIAIIVLSVFLKGSHSEKKSAEEITVKLISDPKMSLIRNGQLDQAKLNAIQNMDYDSLKTSLESNNDFCLYIEDEQGNVLLSKESAELKGACR